MIPMSDVQKSREKGTRDKGSRNKGKPKALVNYLFEPTPTMPWLFRDGNGAAGDTHRTAVQPNGR